MAQLRFGGLESQGSITLAVATTGSDAPNANRPARIVGGNYSAYPYATIQAAIDALPHDVRTGVSNTLRGAIINVGAGNFDGVMIEGMRAYSFLRIAGTRQTATPATGPSSGTATGGGTRTLTDSGATWTTDDLVGRFLNITSGPGAGQILLIAANDATNIYLADPCSPLPASGSVYTIQDLATVINVASPRVTATGVFSATGIYAFRNLGFIDLRDLKITAGTYGYAGQNNTLSGLRRVVCQGVGYGVLEQNTTKISFNQVGAITCSVSGITLANLADAINAHRGWLAKSCGVGIDIQHCIGSSLIGVYSRNSTSQGLQLTGIATGSRFSNTLIDTAAIGVQLRHATIDFDSTEVKNCSSTPFQLVDSRLRFETALVGSGNTGWGLNVKGSGNVVELVGMDPTISGASGEVTVDGTTDFTWAALDTVNDYAVGTVTGARINRQ